MRGRILAAACVVVAGLGCAAPGSPIRAVVVTAGGIDEEPDARLARDVAAELREVGFGAVVDPEPLGDGDLAKLARKRASAAGAAHAVVLRTSAVKEREGVLPGTALHAVKLEVSVVNEDPDLAVQTESMEFVSEDLRSAGVAWRVLEAWVDGLSPWIVEQLYTTPQVAAVQPTDVEVEELGGLQRVRELESAAGSRSEKAQAWKAWCDDQAERMEALASTEDARCFGDPCALATVLGTDARGRAIVEDTSRRPIFTIPLKDDVWWEPPERLYALPLDGGAGQTLLRSGNFYGFASFRPGADVGAVELFSSEGSTALVAFDLADGRRRALSIYAPDEESLFSRAAPDGSGVFACLQDGGCFWDAGAGRVPMRGFRRAEFVALADGVRVFGQLQAGDLALDTPGRTDGGTAKVRGNLEWVLGVHDGHVRAVVGEPRGCALVDIEPERMAVAATTPMPDCIDFPTLLPDGRVLGTAWASAPGDAPGDPEVVTWTPGSDALVPLTKGSFEEQYAFPTRDGKKVVFNRELPPSWESGVRIDRRIVCALDVPPPGVE